MPGFWSTFWTRLRNSVLCLCLGLLVTSCSNPGVALNSQPVIRNTTSTDSAEAVEMDQARVDAGSLDEAINGSGL